MKTIAYYYDGYEDKPIWFDEAVGGLERYYNSYDIDVANLSYKNSETIKNFINKVGRNWYSMMTSRVLYLSDFLKTDYDMMIVTDMDYVVLRADIDIRKYLNSDLIIPRCYYCNPNDKSKYLRDKMKFYDSINPGAFDKFVNGSRFIHLSCDYFVMSRKCCQHMIDFYSAYGWDINNWEKFADKYLERETDTMIDEGFFGCYLNYLNDNPTEDIKMDCPSIERRSNTKISSSTWGDYKIDLQKMCSEENIFHHFGKLSKEAPEELLRLLKLFKKG
jgi:hypothetical protein